MQNLIAVRESVSRSQTGGRAPRSGRKGSVVAIIIASLALALAIFATVWSIVMRPSTSTDSIDGMPGKGLSAYDFDTPQGALVSELRIQDNTDIKAQIQLQHKRRGRALREQIDTMKVENTEDYDRSKDTRSAFTRTDDAKEFDPVVKVLFVSYESSGKKRHEVRYFQRHKDSGMWLRTYVYIPAYNTPAGLQGLQKKIRDWQSSGSTATSSSKFSPQPVTPKKTF